MRRLTSLCLALMLALPAIAHAQEPHWVGSWMAAPIPGDAGSTPPALGFSDATLRQVLRLTLGGRALRVRLSNAFGTAPLTIPAAHVALAAKGAAIQAGSDRALTFGGQAGVTIPAGGAVWSDPVDMAVPAFTDLALSLRLRDVPGTATTHPGSRATSYLQAGDALAADMPGAAKVAHWYIATGVDVATAPDAAALVVLGDSITDGRDSTTDGNGRWPDALARNLARRMSPAPSAEDATSISVLNAGIGGNRLLLDGIGPNALSRVDRDVLDQSGVRWLVVLEGVNDLASAVRAADRKEVPATVETLAAAYRRIVDQAHAAGLKVYGATILPCAGSDWCLPAMEPMRQRLNAWIRASRTFDAVIDLDRTLDDPARPGHLLPEADGGDHLHPGDTGYRLMAEGVDLSLFAR
ncbi:MAG: SGNH/GDSL hydrolase family protein [Azospirillaceae bacterium]|nr:SGNH/GDSL hydrolase family protein [Azospirillaceae bacterium]